ncbi:unnamed protein product [Caenorhabditis brenneri]
MSMPSEERPLSYPALLSVLKKMNYDKKSEIAVVSPEICKIHKRIGYSLKSLSFIQEHGKVDENGIPEEVGTGEVHVESIKYRFEHNPETNKVEVKCSLTPEKKLLVEDISIARRYFHHFLTTSKQPVQHLFLTECDRPFRNMIGLQNTRIKWNLSGAREFPLFQDFPENHIFEKLELSGYGTLLLTEKQVKNCKHLVLRKEEIYSEYVIGNEERTIRNHYCTLNNSILELYLGLNHMESFLLLCEHILVDTFQIGSSFTAFFKKTGFLKNYVWNSLLERFDRAVEGVLKQGECVVLRIQNDHITAVFTNYYGNDDMYRESYTVVKLKRNLEYEPELSRES